MPSSKRPLVILLVVFAALAISGVAYRTYRNQRVAATQRAVDQKMDGLTAPARRSAPVSLTPNRP
jgi:hypothetical protein